VEIALAITEANPQCLKAFCTFERFWFSVVYHLLFCQQE
jgi:hypothetical protein